MGWKSPDAEGRPSRARRIAPTLIGLSFVAVVLAGYTLTLAPGVLGGDAGELQFVPHILSLTHPTGYPLQTLLNKLWAMLIPWETIAWRTNLLSAVVAAWGAGLVFALLFRSAASLGAALIGAVALAAAPVYWGQAVLGDKYALNGLLAAGLLWAAWRFYASPGIRPLALLAFVSGLGLAHHRSFLVFGVPILALLAVKGWRTLRRPAAWAAAGLALLAPLLLYSYVPWAAARGLPPDSGEVASWAQFVTFMLDAGYLGQVGFVPQAGNVAFFLAAFEENFGLALTALALVGFGARWLRWPAHRGWLLFVLAGFLLQAYLTQNYDVPRRFVFFIPAYVCAAALIGEGAAGWLDLARLAAGRFAPRAARLAPAAACAAFLVLVLFPLPARWQLLWLEQRSARPLDIWRQDLKTGEQADRMAASLALVAPRSLIVGDWEQATPLWYAQQVEGVCPDCLIYSGMHRLSEYTARAVAEGRPLYVARTLNQAAEWSEPTAAGPLVYLAQAPETQRPANLTALDWTFGGHVRLAGYTWPLGQPALRPGAVLPISLIWQQASAPAPDYALSLRLIGPAGEVWRADSAAPVLGMFPFSLFTTGQVVADYHEPQIPMDAPPGGYVLQVLLYRTLAAGGFENAVIADAGGHVIGDIGQVLRFDLTSEGR